MSQELPVEAIIKVHGPRQLLGAFRKRLADTFRQDHKRSNLLEAHTGEEINFSISASDGIPFPELIAISARYPDCVAIVNWSKGSAGGETTIQNGQVKEASRGVTMGGSTPIHIRIAENQTLGLAVAIDIQESGIIGYCAASDAETWFRVEGYGGSAALRTVGGDPETWDELWSNGECVTPPTPMPIAPKERKALESLAEALRAEWLWYDHAPLEETIVERQRFDEAGRPVHAINVKSIKLAEHSPGTVSGIAPNDHWIVTLIENTWGQQIPS